MVEDRNTHTEDPDQPIPAPELAGVLREVIGDEITALLLFRDNKDPNKIINLKELDVIIGGSREIDPDIETRIRTAHQITAMLKTAESPQTIKAWFMGMNPVLEGRSPSFVIASSHPEEALEAAMAFMGE